MGSKKNILRKMNDFFSGWERIRVVLLGSKGTGKTVFLTSVGDQLRHHVESFNLNGWSVVFDPDNDDKIQERLANLKSPYSPMLNQGHIFQRENGLSRQRIGLC